MTLQPLPSGFPYTVYEEKKIFYQCFWYNNVCNGNSCTSTIRPRLTCASILLFPFNQCLLLFCQEIFSLGATCVGLFYCLILSASATPFVGHFLICVVLPVWFRSAEGKLFMTVVAGEVGQSTLPYLNTSPEGGTCKA